MDDDQLNDRPDDQVTRHPGVLLHLFGPADVGIDRAVQVATNARRDLIDWPISLVLQGPVVRAVTRGSTVLPSIRALVERTNVDVVACGNSLAGAGLTTADLYDAVLVVPSAVGYLARQQACRWSYIKL
jgi:intracellular sulfur oxidation DsrE/DsrF family protein